MKPGDIVKNIEPYHEDHVNRNIGTVLSFDTYSSTKSDWNDDSGNSERIVEIMWSTGEIDWILLSRLEVISED